MSKPISRDFKYSFAFGNTELDVDPSLGGRVTSLKAHGQEVLTGPDVDSLNFGSTFWTSPQLDWDVWPTVAAIDHEPYRVISADRDLVIASDRGKKGKVDVSVTKRFCAVPEREAMRIEYIIRNEAELTQAYAPWEVTRVFPNGLSVYQTGNPIQEHGGNAPLVTHTALGHTWYEYDASKIHALHNKLYADSPAGFLAHVTRERVLFLKTFPVISPAQQAPGQGMIEIYATGKHSYLELEQQGAYTALAPEQALHWTVHWFVRKLPPEVEVMIGSESLLAYIQTVIA